VLGVEMGVLLECVFTLSPYFLSRGLNRGFAGVALIPSVYYLISPFVPEYSFVYTFSKSNILNFDCE
jgi:hypothetical protein